MTTVDDVAGETGTPTSAVLSACHELGIVASSGVSGLSRDEHERLRTALGAPGDLPAVGGGSTRRAPGAPTERDGRGLQERRDELRVEARRARVDPRKAVRYAVYAFLVLAVGVAVASLAGRDADDGAEPAVLAFSAADEGACVDLDEGGGRSQVVIVECADPHDAELYEVTTIEGDDTSEFPGGEALLGQARADCDRTFTDYVGRSYAESSLDVVFLVPTPETWSVGDRSILCLVEDPSGRLVGSVRGLDR